MIETENHRRHRGSPVGLLAAALVLGAATVAIAGDGVVIRLKSGEVIEGELLELGSRVYKVKLPDGSVREVRENDVTGLEFVRGAKPDAAPKLEGGNFRYFPVAEGHQWVFESKIERRGGPPSIGGGGTFWNIWEIGAPKADAKDDGPRFELRNFTRRGKVHPTYIGVADGHLTFGYGPLALQLFPASGDLDLEWQYQPLEGWIGAAEALPDYDGTVTVPAGTFEHCIKVKMLAMRSTDDRKQAIKLRWWLAPDVGPVKLLIDEPGKGGESTRRTFELARSTLTGQPRLERIERRRNAVTGWDIANVATADPGPGGYEAPSLAVHLEGDRARLRVETRDWNTDEPVAGVAIRAGEGAAVTTGADGVATIEPLPAKSFHLAIEHAAYRRWVYDFDPDDSAAAPAPAAAENAAPLYRKAFASYAAVELASDDDEGWSMLDASSAWTEPWSASFVPGVEKNGTVVDYLRQAAALQDCDFGVKPDRRTGFDFAGLDLNGPRAIAGVALLAARRAEHEKRWADAIALHRAVFRLAGHVDQQETLLTYLLAKAITGMGRKSARMLLERLPSDEALLAALARAVGEVDALDPSAAWAGEGGGLRARFEDGAFAIDTLGELAGLPLERPLRERLRDVWDGKASDEEKATLAKALWVEPGDLETEPKVAVAVARNAATVTVLVQAISDAFAKPYPERSKALARIETVRSPVADHFAETAGQLSEKVVFAEAYQRATKMVILGRLAAARLGRAPTSLEEIIEATLDVSRPEDAIAPRTGETFAAKIDAEGLTVMTGNPAPAPQPGVVMPLDPRADDPTRVSTRWSAGGR